MIKRRLSLQIPRDILVIFICLYSSFLLRFGGLIPLSYLKDFFYFSLVFVVIKIIIFSVTGIYNISWKYTSLAEILNILKSHIYSLFIFTVIFTLRKGFPRSILVIDFFISFVSVCGLRLFSRIYFQIKQKVSLSGFRTLIVGAGDAGEQIARNILNSKDPGYLPIGFIDDDITKSGLVIHGVRVLGNRSRIAALARTLGIKVVIIAMPSVSSSVIKETVGLCRHAGIMRIKILPSINELISGTVSVKDIKDISAEDLLERQEVRVNFSLIERSLKDKKILVTGGAGSIGSELCRKVLRFSPAEIVIFDQDETGIFNIYHELKEAYPQAKIIFVVGNIRDEGKINSAFSQYRPEIVFHAAAYKHVPIMEEFPEEAVKTNIFGTLNLIQSCLKYEVEKFVLVSTDKAVCPSSVMGATKKIAEMVVHESNNNSQTRFLIVRFGNVLESRGNVLQVFRQQIETRREITITDPDMERYIITVSEAVLLLLEAISEEEGCIFVLDMGRQVKIFDLARRLIKAHGLEPDKDIPIVFTGKRPGEKLSEECFSPQEKSRTSKSNNRIFIIEPCYQLTSEQLFSCLERLQSLLVKSASREEIKLALKQFLPEYRIS